MDEADNGPPNLDPIYPDVSIIQEPIQTSVNGLEDYANLIRNGPAEIKMYLLKESDVILECKVCRSLFRSLANFVSHKRMYCTRLHQRVEPTYPLYQPNEQTVVIEPKAPEEDPAYKKPKALTTRKIINRINSNSFVGRPGGEFEKLTKMKEMRKAQDSRKLSSVVEVETIKGNGNAMFQRVNYVGSEGPDPISSFLQRNTLHNETGELIDSDQSSEKAESIKEAPSKKKSVQVTNVNSALRSAKNLLRGALKGTSPKKGGLISPRKQNLLNRSENKRIKNGVCITTRDPKTPESPKKGLKRKHEELDDSPVPIVECDICKTSFKSVKSLKFHMDHLHNTLRKVYPCLYCKTDYIYLWSVQRHMSKHHGKTFEEINQVRNEILARAYTLTTSMIDSAGSVSPDGRKLKTKPGTTGKALLDSPKKGKKSEPTPGTSKGSPKKADRSPSPKKPDTSSSPKASRAKTPSPKKAESKSSPSMPQLSPIKFETDDSMLLSDDNSDVPVPSPAISPKSAKGGNPPKRGHKMPYSCKDCGKKFFSVKERKEHTKKWCQTPKPLDTSLNGDNTSFTDGEEELNASYIPETGTYKCKACNCGFKSRASLKIHHWRRDRQWGGRCYDRTGPKSRNRYINITDKDYKGYKEVHAEVDDEEEEEDEYEEEEELEEVDEIKYTKGRPSKKELLRQSLSKDSPESRERSRSFGSAVRSSSRQNRQSKHVGSAKQVELFEDSDSNPEGTKFIFTKLQLKKMDNMVDWRRIQCLKCGRFFQRISTLKIHAIRHLGYSRFKCLICEFRCFDYKEILMHLNNKHAKSRKEAEKYIEDVKTGIPPEKKRKISHDASVNRDLSSDTENVEMKPDIGNIPPLLRDIVKHNTEVKEAFTTEVKKIMAEVELEKSVTEAKGPAAELEKSVTEAKGPATEVEKPTEPNVDTQKVQEEVDTPILETLKKPGFTMESPKMPSLTMESSKTPSLIMESPKTPSLTMESPKTPRLIMESPKTIEAEPVKTVLPIKPTKMTDDSEIEPAFDVTVRSVGDKLMLEMPKLPSEPKPTSSFPRIPPGITPILESLQNASNMRQISFLASRPSIKLTQQATLEAVLPSPVVLKKLVQDAVRDLRKPGPVFAQSILPIQNKPFFMPAGMPTALLSQGQWNTQSRPQTKPSEHESESQIESIFAMDISEAFTNPEMDTTDLNLAIKEEVDDDGAVVTSAVSMGPVGYPEKRAPRLMRPKLPPARSPANRRADKISTLPVIKDVVVLVNPDVSMEITDKQKTPAPAQSGPKLGEESVLKKKSSERPSLSANPIVKSSYVKMTPLTEEEIASASPPKKSAPRNSDIDEAGSLTIQSSPQKIMAGKKNYDPLRSPTSKPAATSSPRTSSDEDEADGVPTVEPEESVRASSRRTNDPSDVTLTPPRTAPKKANFSHSPPLISESLALAVSSCIVSSPIKPERAEIKDGSSYGNPITSPRTFKSVFGVSPPKNSTPKLSGNSEVKVPKTTPDCDVIKALQYLESIATNDKTNTSVPQSRSEDDADELDNAAEFGEDQVDGDVCNSKVESSQKGETDLMDCSDLVNSSDALTEDYSHVCEEALILQQVRRELLNDENISQISNFDDAVNVTPISNSQEFNVEECDDYLTLSGGKVPLYNISTRRMKRTFDTTPVRSSNSENSTKKS